MITFTTTLQKFNSKGEKTGWTYIEISEQQAQKLKPGVKVVLFADKAEDGTFSAQAISAGENGVTPPM